MNLWKKTLLATAVAAISTGAMAAETTVAAVNKISAEGIAAQSVANDGSEYKIVDKYTVTSSVNWSKDDTVTFTLDGAKFAAGQTFALVDPLTDTVGTPPAPITTPKATFTLMSASDNQVVFRVAQVQTSGSTTGTFELAITNASGNAGAVILDSDVALDSELTLTTVVRTSAGEVIDATDKDTVVTAEVVSQFKLDAVTATSVDAEFNAGGDTMFRTLSADLVLTSNYTTTGGLQGPFVVDKEKTIVTGSLGAFNGADNGTVTSASGSKESASDTKFVFTHTAATNGNVITLADSATPAKADQIDAGKYKVSYELIDVKGNVVNLNAKEVAGTIALNTASTNIPYLPVGDAVAPFVWVTNASSATYDIYAVATTVNGSQYDLGVVGKAKPGQTKVDVAIVDALKDAGVNTQYETLNLKLYINGATAGTDAVTVYAAYKHIGDSDRLQVPVVQDDEFLNDIK
jgi:hypothetical protein